MIWKNRTLQQCLTQGQVNLLFYVRILWRDMATWINSYLIAKYAGLRFADSLFLRIYQIPQEFGNMLQYIFGYDVAQRYIQLLSQYVILMKGLIDAQVAGNPNVANQQIRELYKNADEQAGFLALNNPFWNRTELRNLMYTFNSLIIEQITALLGGNYQRNIDAFDRLLHHSDTIGNYATQGLFNYLSYYSQNTNSK